MKRYQAYLLLLAACPALAQACTCGSWAPFLEASKATPVVVHARVLEYGNYSPGGYPVSMLIEVISPVRNAKAGEKIKVWGDPGFLCRPYVSNFPVGTEWVFALGGDSMFMPKQEHPQVREISIGGCGAYWLLVQGGRVIGELRKAGAKDNMALVDLIRSYGSNP